LTNTFTNAQLDILYHTFHEVVDAHGPPYNASR